MSLKQGVVDQPHPLEHSWTFWFDNLQAKSKQATWGSSTRPIYTFSTIEQFWSLTITYTTQASKWTVTFQKGKSDNPWLYTLLALIGEQFDYGDEIFERAWGNSGKICLIATKLSGRCKEARQRCQEPLH
ncbi:hypothetical protein V6N12_016957 [Hibiscus sabdariffa]|uniref:Eukaryotic translation initiation factor 4E-1 n=1 Tax=Hibiscus sabdariffa TaxID=183260 RepID=A0ABR2ATL4_9ROSI